MPRISRSPENKVSIPKYSMLSSWRATYVCVHGTATATARTRLRVPPSCTIAVARGPFLVVGALAFVAAQVSRSIRESESWRQSEGCPLQRRRRRSRPPRTFPAKTSVET